MSIRDAIAGQARSADLEPGMGTTEDEADNELDLTTLPELEEYRYDGKA